MISKMDINHIQNTDNEHLVKNFYQEFG